MELSQINRTQDYPFVNEKLFVQGFVLTVGIKIESMYCMIHYLLYRLQLIRSLFVTNSLKDLYIIMCITILGEC
jgi:hypothetical protein